MITSAIQDSWDDDSEARLTAAGILCRLDTVREHPPPASTGTVNAVSSTPAAPTVALATAEDHIICSVPAQIDQAMPPPYSAEDPHPHDPAATRVAPRARFHFQSSLPVLRSNESGHVRSLNARSRNICNSAVLERDAARRQSAVRYSLVLGPDHSSVRPRTSNALTTSVSVELATLQASHESGGNPELARPNSQSPLSASAVRLSQLQKPASGRVGGAQAPELSPNMEVSERSAENTLNGEPDNLAVTSL